MKEEDLKKELERSMAMVLWIKGYRYIVRDEVFGLQTFKNKPTKRADIWYATGGVEFLKDDSFLNVRVEQSFPTRIFEDGSLHQTRVRVGKQKVVAV